jgi:hypothetical protein
MDDSNRRVVLALIEAVAMILVTVLAHPDIKREWQMRFYRSAGAHARAVAERAGRIAIACEHGYNNLCGG